MIQFAKKVSVLGFVVIVSSVGIGVGQNLTRRAAEFQLARASSSESSLPAAQQDRYENLELFNRVLHFVEANYVDEVKNKNLIEGAIKGMLETLDPHSSFLNAELYKDMQTDTSGKFGGLGIEIGMKDNILTILAPIEDTPAWKAGLKPNDRIVKINSESTKGMNLIEAVSKMRGKPKTDVNLSIYREGFDKIKDIKVTRDIIKIQSVKSEPLEAGYGYARLTTFNESAGKDLKKAIEELGKKAKLRGLVLDLRYNPGGLLDQAVEVASLFVDEGPIVSTIGRNHDQKDVKYARKGLAFKDFSVAILVNSSTASAAEIVAGALQDDHRAIIMGQPTFGKGSVQTVIPLPPDMGLKLTIARYYTPSGRSIQEKGVVPDILLEEFDSRLLTKAKIKPEPFRERDLKGHMLNTDEEGAKEFKKEELDALAKEPKKKLGDKADSLSSKDSKDSKDKDDDEMVPLKMNPKEDYQVKQALIALKSFQIFKKTSESGKEVPKLEEKIGTTKPPTAAQKE
ncbi:MAG: S41 family peptidase [Bdellovibrionia bacterium]